MHKHALANFRFKAPHFKVGTVTGSTYLRSLRLYALHVQPFKE